MTYRSFIKHIKFTLRPTKGVEENIQVERNLQRAYIRFVVAPYYITSEHSVFNAVIIVDHCSKAILASRNGYKERQPNRCDRQTATK